MSLDRMVVVGASVAGVSAAEEFRRQGFSGSITLLDAEAARPYDKPPLSKQFLTGAWGDSQLALRDDSFYQDLAIDLRVGCAATGIDGASRMLTLGTGERIPFDGLVLATGSAARWPQALPRLRGMHTLRSIADASGIRRDLETASDVVVIGGGFIGAEVASSARARGLSVTLIESTTMPMGRVLGPDVGRVMAGIHQDHGVRVRCGVQVVEVRGGDCVEQLVLSDGRVLDAELVVVGVGAEPVTDWLVGAGVQLDDGILADEFCETAIEGVFTAGDVARWRHPVWGLTRIEHHGNAVEQGALVARNALAGKALRECYDPVNYVWSDQYEHALQMLGTCSPQDDQRVLDGSLDARSFVIGCFRRGELVGTIGLDSRRQLMRSRSLVEARAGEEKVAEVFPSATSKPLAGGLQPTSERGI